MESRHGRTAADKRWAHTIRCRWGRKCGHRAAEPRRVMPRVLYLALKVAGRGGGQDDALIRHAPSKAPTK